MDEDALQQRIVAAVKKLSGGGDEWNVENDNGTSTDVVVEQRGRRDQETANMARSEWEGRACGKADLGTDAPRAQKEQKIKRVEIEGPEVYKGDDGQESQVRDSEPGHVDSGLEEDNDEGSSGAPAVDVEGEEVMSMKQCEKIAEERGVGFSEV